MLHWPLETNNRYCQYEGVLTDIFIHRKFTCINNVKNCISKSEVRAFCSFVNVYTPFTPCERSKRPVEASIGKRAAIGRTPAGPECSRWNGGNGCGNRIKGVRRCDFARSPRFRIAFLTDSDGDKRAGTGEPLAKVIIEQASLFATTRGRRDVRDG